VLVADQAPAPVQLCHDPGQHLVCPNLVMPPASRLMLRRTAGGRRLLQMDNYLVNAGYGDVIIRGHRTGRYTMEGVQLIERSGGRGLARVKTGAVLTWKYVDTTRGNFWKFRHAARFELWGMNTRGERTRWVRTGPKLDYCLRDLFRMGPRKGSTVPAGPRYGACSQDLGATTDILGIASGWADGYPYSYPQNYIDVTGLRGCYVIIQRADPYNGIVETSEKDNTSHQVVKLPYRRGSGGSGCPRYRGLGVPT
jgi:hypothetical protein